MYKLVVEDTVKVPVKFETNNAGKGKAFNFCLICDRLPQDEITKIFEAGDVPVVDVLKRVTTGWENQTLVVDDDKKPVEFNADSFDVMLSLTAIQNVIWISYLKEIGAKTKN